MSEKRTVKINGEELEVEINLNDDGSYEATVEGQTFTVEAVSYTHLRAHET